MGGRGRLINDDASTETAVSLRQLRFEHTRLGRYDRSQIDRQSAVLNVQSMAIGRFLWKHKFVMDNSLGIKKADQCSFSLILTIALFSVSGAGFLQWKRLYWNSQISSLIAFFHYCLLLKSCRKA
jgi:hypothetical protein